MPRKLQVPGPGAYDVSNPWPSKSISIKGSSRASMQGSEFAPGPGEYAPQGATDKARPRCLFTKSNRFSDMPDDAPGPCEYSPRNPSHVAPRMSMGQRSGKVALGTTTMTPGPGAYTPGRGKTVGATNFARGASRWMHTTSTAAGSFDSPGPAAYELDPRQCAKRVPAAGFGTTPRLGSNSAAWTSRTPGPGQYMYDIKSKAPKISMTPRREDIF
eukprot:TRINITY_DN39759_c0_g1_i1.p1 TRINITY_DN39759_c0_g1~~TRINITY_DN39759_c0_g1_i1.p1  ORF type:complete len:215 (+),score=11.27 TRINITY_DN39759_c0_g1_i1:125-769(+)